MANSESKVYGRIYLITNRVNGKRYVGQTVGSIAARWMHHCGAHSRCKALASAITKYGADAFTIEDLAVAYSDRHLNELERHHVNSLGTLAPAGYNLKEGGGSKGKWSDGMLRRITEAQNTPEAIARNTASSTAMWARPETRQKISDAIRNGLSAPGVREKRSAIAKVSSNTAEAKARISAGQRARFESAAERERMREASLRRWSDPEMRRKMIENRAATLATPEAFARASAAQKKKWADPEYKKRVTAAQQAGKARKKALAAEQAA